MEYYLTIDIGGTNITMGLMKVNDDSPSFTLIETQAYKSQEHDALIPILKEFVSYTTHKYALDTTPPINISACGPTDGLVCQPTNLPDTWTLRKSELERVFDTTVFLINDFAAVGYSLMTLKENDEKICHIAGSPTYNDHDPASTQPERKLVLGAGTGLGCANIQKSNSHLGRSHVALTPSESGWLDFAPDFRNPHEVAYAQFLANTQDETSQLPAYSWEDAISASRGFNNIYHFFCDTYYSTHIIHDKQRAHLVSTFKSYSSYDRPFHISHAAHDGDEACIAIIKFWVALYARCARQVALASLPSNGVFLGGGAAGKNTKFFNENNLFHSCFTSFQNKAIKKIITQIPLYIITEYQISLYGNAFHLFTQMRS